MDIDDIIDLFDGHFWESLGIGIAFTGASIILRKSRYPVYYPNTQMPVEVPSSLDESVKKALKELLEDKDQDDREDIKEELSKIEYKPVRRIESPDTLPDFTISTLSVRRPDEILARMDFVRGIIFSSVYSAIEKKKASEELEGLSYFTLDLPLKNKERTVDLVRLTRRLEQNQVEFQIMKSYQMEPMFPRLFFSKGGEMIEKELPDSVRSAAVAIFRKYMDKQKLPFTQRQCEMLDMILEKPEISSAMIAERMNITQDSVRGYLKEVALTAFRLFETLFNPRKDVALYWHEMGLSFPKS